MALHSITFMVFVIHLSACGFVLEVKKRKKNEKEKMKRNEGKRKSTSPVMNNLLLRDAG